MFPCSIHSDMMQSMDPSTIWTPSIVMTLSFLTCLETSTSLQNLWKFHEILLVEREGGHTFFILEKSISWVTWRILSAKVEPPGPFAFQTSENPPPTTGHRPCFLSRNGTW